MIEASSLKADDMHVEEERRKMPDPSAMAVQLDRIQVDVDSLHKSLQTLTENVGKLAVFEERQAHLHEENQRALLRIEAVDACGKKEHAELFQRLRVVESQMLVNTKSATESSAWINHALTALAGAVFVYVAVQTGLIG